jgi:DNA-binding transcriptional MerR regulator
MAQWYVKDISKLTGVSVQTLHHYDRLGLLQPSIRLPNGYRVYSEKDLLKLQQIIALKYFGFELAKIKSLLSKESNIFDNFAVQARLLDEKAKTLAEASLTLSKLISNCDRNKSIPWETIIQSIEVYRMTQQLEKTWAGKIFTPEELKEYAHFEQGLKSRFSETELNSIQQVWGNLVKDVNASLDEDPSSEFGIALGKRCMDWVNAYYGKKHITLRNTIWQKGLKAGLIEHEDALSVESFAWLDQAITAYYTKLVLDILNRVKTASEKQLIKELEALLEDMHGNDRTVNLNLFYIILQKDDIAQDAKSWVSKYMKEHGYGK